MKRFTGDGHPHLWNMVPEEHGEWVRYEDATVRIERLEGLLREAADHIHFHCTDRDLEMKIGKAVRGEGRDAD